MPDPARADFLLEMRKETRLMGSSSLRRERRAQQRDTTFLPQNKIAPDEPVSNY
jgi:hypothetical protein